MKDIYIGPTFIVTPHTLIFKWLQENFPKMSICKDFRYFNPKLLL